MRALILVADALLLGMPIVPARARIHRSHQHKRRGILCRIFCPTDTNNPVLQRLTHHLQNGAIEFRQFIQAEEMVPFPHPRYSIDTAETRASLPLNKYYNKDKKNCPLFASNHLGLDSTFLDSLQEVEQERLVTLEEFRPPFVKAPFCRRIGACIQRSLRL